MNKPIKIFNIKQNYRQIIFPNANPRRIDRGDPNLWIFSRNVHNNEKSSEMMHNYDQRNKCANVCNKKPRLYRNMRKVRKHYNLRNPHRHLWHWRLQSVKLWRLCLMKAVRNSYKLPFSKLAVCEVQDDCTLEKHLTLSARTAETPKLILNFSIAFLCDRTHLQVSSKRL